MPKTNDFKVKKIKENNIVIEESRKNRSNFVLFFRKNGGLIFVISLLLSLTVFIIAVSLTISNLKESSIVEYESNGVIVTFDSSDNSIINGLPITSEYANKIFDSSISQMEKNKGVVIKIKEINLNARKIIFYSDKTALVKYNNGEYLKVSAVGNEYGITEEGIINKNATTKTVTGEIKENKQLNISILYLSDGSVEVTKDGTVFLVRNNDITNNESIFYTNLSIVSVPIRKEGNKTYYSKGTIKENNYIIVNGTKYNKVEEKKVHDNITIIYYENNFAEVIKDELSIIVENSEHIKYNDNIFEIVEESYKDTTKDVMDIKNININNTNESTSKYIIVLEETNNYQKHNVTNILASEYINYNININGNKISNNVLKETLIDKEIEGISLSDNSYLLYEGEIDKLSEISIKLGFWISYEKITNKYMDSTFIGTVKIYVESIN